MKPLSLHGEEDRVGGRFVAAATAACKGVALLLLLWYHLFYLHPEYGFIVRVTSLSSKACVAIFVILSGYGLAAAAGAGKVGLLAFYKRRLSRLYVNYWLIAALFIAIGVLTGLRPIAAAYPTRPFLNLALELAGLGQYLAGGPGYNATWWYVGLIVPLYLLFPFLNWLARKCGWWFLLPSALLLAIGGTRLPMLRPWLFPFCLGIYLAQRDLLPAISARLARAGRFRFVLLALLLAAVACLQLTIFAGGGLIDGPFGALVIVSTFEVIRALPAAKGPLGFLGRHLFNIFLFHTFIYFYFWPELIYAPRNPVAILGLLLGICLAVSLLLERLKSLAGFSRLQAAIDRLPVPDTPRL